MNRLRVGTDDKVAQIDSRPLGRPVGRDVHDQESMLLIGTGTGAPLLWQRNFLHCDPKVGLRDMATLQQFLEHAVDGLGGQGNDRRACQDRAVDA